MDDESAQTENTAIYTEDTHSVASDAVVTLMERGRYCL